MKKHISYSIISVILLTLLGLILFLQIPRINYKYNDTLDGYVITNVYGNSKSYTIPNKYKDKPVIMIENKAFEKQTRLETLIFEDDSNIHTIKQNAFYKCCSLKEIKIPDSVVKIENNAFLGCTNLKNVVFNDTSKLKVLEGSVFFDCSSLEVVKLPLSSVYEIGDYCFYNTNIKKLELDKNVMLYENSLFGVNEEYIVYK